MKISIVIPIYGMYGNGFYFLDRNLMEIFQQDYNDFEVIISDNSEDDELYELTKDYVDNRIKHFFCNEKGSSANMNNAIRHATGEIIKPIFQDDSLCSVNCLSELAKNFKKDKWFIYPRYQIVDVYLVGDLEKIVPYWNDKIIYGRNTISSPSAIAYPASANLFFDENLNWLMDVEFYYRLYLKYGKPVVLENAVVNINEWDGQVSNSLTKEDKKKDLEYVKDKYDL